MAAACFDPILKIADDRKMTERHELNKPETRRYVEQFVQLLKIFYLATKHLEGDNSATISKVVPVVLNILLELEDPEVICL